MQPRLWSVNGMSVELRRERRTLNRIISDSGVQPVKETKRSKPYYISDIVSAVLGTPAGELDLVEQPALLAREQRRKLEFQNAESERKLIPANQIEEVWLRGVSIAQSRFLGVPTKTAALVSAAKSASEAQGIIRRAIYESLAGCNVGIIRDIAAVGKNGV